MFARYRTPVQSISRWAVADWQQQVYLRGATTAQGEVRRGDFVLASTCGGIVVPASLVEDVLARAEQVTAAEVAIRAAPADGARPAECLARLGRV